jgi:hypothetical protein
VTVDIREHAKKVAASASVALATTGLSSCFDNGAVDPLPPPLQCNTVNNGQTLNVTANRTADTVSVTLLNIGGAVNIWRVDRVVALSGATLLSTTPALPAGNQPIGILLKLDTPTTTEARFRVDATFTGVVGETCAVTRTFVLTISATGVQVSSADTDELPLAARQKASILIARQEANMVELVARTPYQGSKDISWSVTEGELDASSGETVRWTLPTTPGMYQAELVVDFGADGIAFDALVIEVS